MRSLVCGAALLSSVAGHACCLSYADIAVKLVAETALVIWDEGSKTEHFVRKASFMGNAKDFGFILPVPNRPFAIEVADEAVFQALEARKPRPASIGCAGAPNDVAASKSAGGVEVLEQKNVGDYEATVLRAEDGSALSGWLSARGHKMRPAMTPWFQHYSNKKWVFVAFKYRGGADVETKAVRVSFKAAEPFYPYKMPTDTWEPGHFRPLDLFVLSSEEVAGEFTNGQIWRANRPWSTPVTGLKPIEGLLSTPSARVTLPDEMVLTRFENSPAASNYDYDLTFKPVPDKTLLYATFAVAAVFGIGYLRRRARAA